MHNRKIKKKNSNLDCIRKNSFSYRFIEFFSIFWCIKKRLQLKNKECWILKFKNIINFNCPKKFSSNLAYMICFTILKTESILCTVLSLSGFYVTIRASKNWKFYGFDYFSQPVLSDRNNIIKTNSKNCKWHRRGFNSIELKAAIKMILFLEISLGILEWNHTVKNLFAPFDKATFK